MKPKLSLNYFNLALQLSGQIDPKLPRYRNHYTSGGNDYAPLRTYPADQMPNCRLISYKTGVALFMLLFAFDDSNARGRLSAKLLYERHL